MPKSTIITFAQKREGEKPDPVKPHELHAFWEQAPPGCYVITIKRERPPKSQKQLGVIFGLMIGQAVQQAADKAIGVEGLMKYLLAQNIPMGVAITEDYLHALMYVICPTVDDKGNKVTLSKMNTKQASELFGRFRNILAPLGIVIDDSDKDWRNSK